MSNKKNTIIILISNEMKYYKEFNCQLRKFKKHEIKKLKIQELKKIKKVAFAFD